jgi:hypothetical protein
MLTLVDGYCLGVIDWDWLAERERDWSFEVSPVLILVGCSSASWPLLPEVFVRLMKVFLVCVGFLLRRLLLLLIGIEPFQ